MGDVNRMGTDPTISGGSLPSATHVSDEAELAPNTMVGEYRIEGVLGAGGMGRVYGAVHPVIGKRAAVKVLHPALSVEREAVDRFVQEARAVNQIGHPNIVDIFAFGNLPDGRCYFVMEQLRGESLGKRIEREPVPILDALSILDTIAIALEAAHRKGIIHRDLKPDNVFLVELEGGPPQVKLLDFGIAKLVGSDVPLQRTRTGNVMGTPAYISPEQARGQGVDHRTDIYAFGAVAFELLTRRWPFPATNAADMIAKHLFEAPPSTTELNPEVEPQLDHLIKRMLAKEANERPTLEQARQDLRAARNRVHQRVALHEGGHTDPIVNISHPQLQTRDPLAMSMPIDPPSLTVVKKREARKRRVILVGVAVVLVALVGGAIVMFGGGDREQQARPAHTPPAAAPVDQPAASPPAPPEVDTPPSAPAPEPATAEPQVTEPAETERAEAVPNETTKPSKPSPPTTRPTTKPTTKPPSNPKPPVDDPDAPM